MNLYLIFLQNCYKFRRILLSDFTYPITFRIFTARKRSLGQGNVLTPVCHSVYTGEGVSLQGGLHLGEGSLHPGGTSAYTGVCPQGGRGSASRGVYNGGDLSNPNSPLQLEKRVVCILLECFLVIINFI